MNLIIALFATQALATYKALAGDCFQNSDELTHYRNSYRADNDNRKMVGAKPAGELVDSITCYKIDLVTFSF